MPLISQKKAQSAASRKYFFPRRGMRLYTTRQNGRNTTRNAVEKKEVRALPFPARNNEESSISAALLRVFTHRGSLCHKRTGAEKSACRSCGAAFRMASGTLRSGRKKGSLRQSRRAACMLFGH